ncbi:MAG: NUDIX hydrolase [Candidatus Doudnabacteria bacterium]|nr:NUDIX hydrolase [Candidatus Doudnabacteria bacterium]
MSFVPPEEYYKNLPRKYIGSGALYLNEKGEILIVKPKYKEGWEVPGGVVEPNESPQEACIREIKEELGLNINPKQLLVMDFRSLNGYIGDAIMLLYFGGTLNQEEIDKIKLDSEELSEYRFVTLDQAEILVTERLKKRLPKVVNAYKTGTCISLKDGEEFHISTK